MSVIHFGRSESLKQILCRFLLNVCNGRQRVSFIHSSSHQLSHSHPFHVELTWASLLIRVPPVFCLYFLSTLAFSGKQRHWFNNDWLDPTHPYLRGWNHALCVRLPTDTQLPEQFPFSVSWNSISHGPGETSFMQILIPDPAWFSNWNGCAMKTRTAIEWMTRLFSGNKTGKRMRASFFFGLSKIEKRKGIGIKITFAIQAKC